MQLAVLGVIAWRLSEVQVGPTAAVELHTDAGGCWFPSTEVVSYDGGGGAIDAVAPFAVTTCFAAETWLALAAPPQLPAAARQVCLRSSGTIYDCVRWAGVTVPVHDFLGPDDDSVAQAPPSGWALARIADTNVIADDWIVEAPTPGAPNDGTPYVPPDAGVPLPDAGVVDGGIVPDARPASPDATPPPDAKDDAFLDLDAQGGAGCGCQGAPDPGGAALLVLLSLCRRSSGARRSAGRGPRGAPTSRRSADRA